jgi:hypothetical protein
MANSYEDFPNLINSAISNHSTVEWNTSEVINSFSENYVLNKVDKDLGILCLKLNRKYKLGNLLGGDLGLRLGKHHFTEPGPNSYGLTLDKFIEQLLKDKTIDKFNLPSNVLLNQSTIPLGSWLKRFLKK